MNVRYILILTILVSVISSPSPAYGARFIFDASCIPMAGDADWVIDAPIPGAGTSGQSAPERFPSPHQCTVGGETAETYWSGGFSAWGIELVKSGHWVETIPRNGVLTYGNCSNPQDLSFYDVLVIPEPQLEYTSQEIDAIIDFVFDGGGLFLVGNHCGSDRNNTGYDSARVFEEMQTALYFGIEFLRIPDGTSDPSCDWDELNNRNFTDDPHDPFIYGPYGNLRAIGFHSATNLILHPENNSTVQGHAWRNGQSQGNTFVTVASCEYGNGRVAAIGDSAPADDGTGDPRDYLINGWTHSTTDNDKLFMNMSHWLTSPDTAPLPTRTPCPQSTPWPYCSGTATPSGPTSTPTPIGTPSTDPIVNIELNQAIYRAGDLFLLELEIENPGPSRSAQLYIALQIGDLYFFAPDWTEQPDSERLYMSDNDAFTRTIFNFIWPEAGRINNAVFWALLLDPYTSQLLGNYDFCSFSSL